jgi:predicted CopG family antitoxin
MSEGWKMLSVWDEIYDSLNELRLEQRTTFNEVIGKLLETYEEQQQEPQQDHE